jgi:hypothetical protein
MEARQAIITILSVPAVFLVCFTMLGVANAMLRMVLDDYVAQRLRTVARWGLPRMIGRMFVHDVRTGQSRYAYFVGGMLSRAWLGSALVTMALVVALAPTGLPPWIVGVSAVVGVVAFHFGLVRDAQTLARAPEFFAEATAKRFPRYGVDRRSIARNALAVVLFRRWSSTVFFALALTMLFALTSLVVANVSSRAAESTDLMLPLSLLVAGPVVAIALALLLGRVIDEFWAGAAAQGAIQRRLMPRRRGGTRLRHLQPPRQVFDRFAEERRELTHIAELLVRAADRLDSRAAGPLVPHPNGVLLRGCAAQVQAHLSSLASLTAPAPPSLDTILAEASVLFVGPPRPDFYEGLNRLATAFNPDGTPVPEFAEAGQKGMWSLVRRATDAVETSHKLVVSSIGIVSVVVLMYLILTGRLGGSALLKP